MKNQPKFIECPFCANRITGKITFRNYCGKCSRYFYFWQIKKIFYKAHGEFKIDMIEIKGKLRCGDSFIVITDNRKFDLKDSKNETST